MYHISTLYLSILGLRICHGFNLLIYTANINNKIESSAIISACAVARGIINSLINQHTHKLDIDFVLDLPENKPRQQHKDSDISYYTQDIYT